MLEQAELEPLHLDRRNFMEIPRHWRLKAQRYRLEGSICPICGQLTFPPRPVCPYCTTLPVQVASPGLVPAAQERLPARQVCMDILPNERFSVPALKIET